MLEAPIKANFPRSKLAAATPMRWLLNSCLTATECPASGAKGPMTVKTDNAQTLRFGGRYGRRFQALTAGKRQNYAAMYGLISIRAKNGWYPPATADYCAGSCKDDDNIPLLALAACRACDACRPAVARLVERLPDRLL